MESKKVLFAVIGLVVAALGVVGMALYFGREPTLVDILQQAEHVVVISPTRDIDVRPGGEFKAKVLETWRGGLKKDTELRVLAPLEGGKPPKLIRGSKFALLLKKSARGGGYDLLGRHLLRVSTDSVRQTLDGDVQGEWTLADFESYLQQNPLKSQLAPRTSPAGRWFLMASQNGTDMTAALIEFSGPAERLEGKLLAASMPAAVLKSASAQGAAVQIVLASERPDLTFHGTFQNGLVLGELQFGDQGVLAARLEPTDAESFAGRDESPPTEGSDAFFKAREQKSDAALEEWLTVYPDSPLVPSAYFYLLGRLVDAKPDRKSLDAFAARYLQACRRWGPLLEQQAHFNMGLLLTAAELLPEAALEHLDAAVKPPSLAPWKPIVKRSRGQILVRQGKDEAGLALLEEVHREFPLDVDAALILAEYDDKHQRVDSAIERYAALVAVPGLEDVAVELLRAKHKEVSRDQLPSTVVERLWKAKHGNTEGLESFLKKTYAARVPPVKPPRVPPRKADQGNRVVLLELFTGGSCKPCVAPDVATDALETAFESTEAIVLRYHENTNGLDPLTNEDTEARMEEVKAKGTPTLLFNGTEVPGAAGSFEMATPLYERLRSEAEAVLKETTTVKLALTASTANGHVRLSAKVEGVDEISNDYRLRVVLAEERIDLRMRNGIRVHRNVVRYMPTGAAGAPPRNGRLYYDDTVDLSALRDNLRRKLEKVDSEFELKGQLPKPLDFKSFRVVAWVSNETTGEVLQAAAVSVPGL